MNIWILQTGEPLPSDSGNPRAMRAMNLSQKLVDVGHNVVLWSSSFDHQRKLHRSKGFSKHRLSNNLEVRLIPSRGYKKHIGIGRLIDHAQMAINLKYLLNAESEVPDIAFIGYPPIETAFVMSHWLSERKVPMVLDVKDLWPTMFVEAFPRLIRPIARVIFHPYFYLSKKTIARADSISAMAPGFIDWIMNYAKRRRSPIDKVFRLTSPVVSLPEQDLMDAKKKWLNLGFKEGMPAVFFVGTFMSVFDFDPIKKAADYLSLNNVDCQFILCGKGAYLDEVKAMMTDVPNYLFPGWVDRVMIESLAEMSIASLAPYKNIDNFIYNTPNKIVDSLMLGKPILSPLEGEVATLIDSYKVGLSYNESLPLGHCIETLISDPELQKDISKNAKSLYQSEFEFDQVYESLVAHLEELGSL